VKYPLDKVIDIAGNVDVNIVEWSGKIDYTIMQMDDFEKILDLEFLKQRRLWWCHI